LFFSQVGLNNNLSEINSYTIPEPIAKSDLYSDEISNLSNLKVKVDTLFYLPTNKHVQLSVTYSDSNGNIVDYTNSSTGTTYKLNVDTTVATITPNGFLRIKTTILPFPNGRLPLRVVVLNGDKIGIGQFAITDTDLDTDLIADSFERRIGLNPNIANLGDLDGDFLLDAYEAMLGSNPLKRDSDSDNFSDFIELQKGTNLTNIDSFPSSIESIASGAWNSANSWSCNCIPASFDNVIINEGHNIRIPNSLSVDCNTILIKQGAIFEAPNSVIFKVHNR
jgi:hypothetical protein